MKHRTQADLQKVKKQELIDLVLELSAERDNLDLRVKALLQKLYDRKSEKCSAEDQERYAACVLALFAAGEDEAAMVLHDEIQETPDTEHVPRKERRQSSRRHPGRARLPEHLERRREELDLSAQERQCSCCQEEMQRIGEDVTEELGRIPAHFFVRQLVRPKYACRKCQEGVVQASLPPRPIEKGKAGADVLADLLVSKYGDHLPLYRLEQIYGRSGVVISRTTMCSWVERCADLLSPVVAEMHRQLLLGEVVASDDTAIRVQLPENRGPTRKGFLWVYVAESQDVIYDFQMDRSQQGPRRFLAGFGGFVQTDAYAGYNEVGRQKGVVLVGCMAHARRGFHEALSSEPELAREILQAIGELYDLERVAKEAALSAKARHALRRQEAIPRLCRLRKRLKQLKKKVLPQSALGQAVSYSLRHWTKLCRYTMDGRLEIDNNRSERAMRRVAVGRKNWVMAGSPAGGERAAILYTLIETCQRNGINAVEYLADVLQRVCTHPNRRISELTPREWKQLRDRASTTAEQEVGAVLAA